MQRALGLVCVQLTMAAQVYGGSMSFVVGAYLWSYNDKDQSFIYPGDTVVSGLSMVFESPDPTVSPAEQEETY